MSITNGDSQQQLKKKEREGGGVGRKSQEAGHNK